jgi:hypothetical protein
MTGSNTGSRSSAVAGKSIFNYAHGTTDSSIPRSLSSLVQMKTPRRSLYDPHIWLASVGLLIKLDMRILTHKLFLNKDVLTSL